MEETGTGCETCSGQLPARENQRRMVVSTEQPEESQAMGRLGMHGQRQVEIHHRAPKVTQAVVTGVCLVCAREGEGANSWMERLG